MQVARPSATGGLWNCRAAEEQAAAKLHLSSVGLQVRFEAGEKGVDLRSLRFHRHENVVLDHGDGFADVGG